MRKDWSTSAGASSSRRFAARRALMTLLNRRASSARALHRSQSIEQRLQDLWGCQQPISADGTRTLDSCTPCHTPGRWLRFLKVGDKLALILYLPSPCAAVACQCRSGSASPRPAILTPFPGPVFLVPETHGGHAMEPACSEADGMHTRHLSSQIPASTSWVIKQASARP